MAVKEKRYAEGYALLFDVVSDGLPFDEVIKRGALDGVIEKSDVMALLNHDLARGLLARSKKGVGSLALEVDSKGLKYRFEIPDTPLGDELYNNLQRGEICESSFSFTIPDDGDNWEPLSNGRYRRTITKIEQLYDVSPVYNAAYSATSVGARASRMADDNVTVEQKYEEAKRKYCSF